MNYIFDIDNTLTDPRTEMNEDFARFFYYWMQDKKVFLVTGNDLPKIEEQIPFDILANIAKIFACSGNAHFHGYGRNEEQQPVVRCSYQSEWEVSDDLLYFLLEKAKQSNCPTKTDIFVEPRTGIVNFSTVGRLASKEERHEYYEFDAIEKEREQIVKDLLIKFPELDATIGGSISIDIYPKGNDKGQIVKWLPLGNSSFFGDKIFPGGNDYSLAQSLDKQSKESFQNNKIYKVSTWKDTHELLEEIR